MKKKTSNNDDFLVMKPSENMITLNNNHSNNVSKVEQYYLDKSGKKLRYEPTEKISIIQVDNFPELGKLTALRFIEWVQSNPTGVVSLPTGKTPEHFIKWTTKVLKDWDTKFIQDELIKAGIDNKQKPTLEGLRFVQIDEFYPIDSNQHNSFYYYIKKYYLKEFGISPDKALLININKIKTPDNIPLKDIFPDNKVDLSLRTRYASNELEKLQKRCIEMVDEFCTNYERKIREMGGIDFFLGGIGPDGHIGFNVMGSDHFSTTRLIHTNYETQSAAATDLGGMEVARNRLVITIGLQTITFKENAIAIIIAAGESKANIIRDSIENSPSNKYPATALQKLPNARFYLTKGAAFRLRERRYNDIKEQAVLDQNTIERTVINLCIKVKKNLTALSNEDYINDKFANLILKKTGSTVPQISNMVASNLKERLLNGLKSVDNSVILHTSPHHDDDMLGYIPYINHLVRNPNNKHHFSYFTSGFTAVTNFYMLNILEKTRNFIELGYFEKDFHSNYFDPGYVEGKNKDVSLFLDGISSRSQSMRDEAVSRRLLRNMIEIYEEDNIVYLKDRVNELINYFQTQYPGKKDIPHVQKLKGMVREWEVEVLWGRYGFTAKDVTHLRLGFYQGDIFTESPEVTRDVLPVLALLEKVKPNIVTLTLDPEGSGPDTHYKVIQVIAEALKMYEEKTGNSEILVWGYRNVWSRFHPAEANIYVPTSLNSFAILENTFMESFGSQKEASFPSWEYDGPFHKLAQKIQVDNYHNIRTCLGEDYFLNHEHPRLRAAKGCVLLKELTLNEFYQYSRDLKKLTENL